MLNKKCMNLEIASECKDYESFNGGNGQSIRENLLRQATKSCDYYSTDVIILLECIEKIFTKDIKEIDIYFRNTGISWLYDNGEGIDNEPIQYRCALKLVKNGEMIELYKTNGNV